MEKREGDWLCSDASCGNINFSKRTKCNLCGKLRPLDQPSKLRGSQKQGDWTCNKCGNLNWARRTHCNICNIVKSSHEPEDRLGRGGGYFDLDDPRDRKEHHSDDEEFDEFGRKKKKSSKSMGIKGLIPFLNEKVPNSMTEMSLESLSGEYIAVDASTALYQFTIAIRDSSYFSSLVNSSGESTSHLYGMMSRCSKLLECGIKPVFVFDSKPPDLKLKTLDKRRQRREEASSSLKQAIAEGDKESIKKLMGRTVKVTKEMNDSAKKLLRLMGVPVIDALEEAEAQCAHLVRNRLCRFVASEDTDTLAFGGGFLLRNVTASSNKKIVKVDLQKALNGLELTFDQFVDFCILCGCDYCDTLEGVGPKTAYTLVKRYSSLEEIVNIKGGNYEDFREAKEYFMSPKVNDYDQASVKMGTLDAEALTDFLVNDNNFAKERVDKFVEKLLKFKGKKVQVSLLSYLTSQPVNAQAKDSSKRAKTAKNNASFRKLKGEISSRNSLSSNTRTTHKKSDSFVNVTVDRYDKPNVEDDDDLLKFSLENKDEKLDAEQHFDSKSKEVLEITDDEENVKNEKEAGLFYNEKDEDLEVEAHDLDKESQNPGEYKDHFKEQKDDGNSNHLNVEGDYNQGNEQLEKGKCVKFEEEEEEEKEERDTKATLKSEKLVTHREEDFELELKVFNNKRVLFDDDEEDELIKTTSENRNCGTFRALYYFSDADNVKAQEEKKGLRNLFDVLVPYPKPIKRNKS